MMSAHNIASNLDIPNSLQKYPVVDNSSVSDAQKYAVSGSSAGNYVQKYPVVEDSSVNYEQEINEAREHETTENIVGSHNKEVSLSDNINGDGEDCDGVDKENNHQPFKQNFIPDENDNSASVTNSMVEAALTRIKELCDGLPSAEYLLLMTSSEDDVHQISSGKGRQFLDSRVNLLQEFVNHCYGADGVNISEAGESQDQVKTDLHPNTQEEKHSSNDKFHPKARGRVKEEEESLSEKSQHKTPSRDREEQALSTDKSVPKARGRGRKSSVGKIIKGKKRAQEPLPNQTKDTKRLKRGKQITSSQEVKVQLRSRTSRSVKSEAETEVSVEQPKNADRPRRSIRRNYKKLVETDKKELEDMSGSDALWDSSNDENDDSMDADYNPSKDNSRSKPEAQSEDEMAGSSSSSESEDEISDKNESLNKELMSIVDKIQSDLKGDVENVLSNVQENGGNLEEDNIDLENLSKRDRARRERIENARRMLAQNGGNMTTAEKNKLRRKMRDRRKWKNGEKQTCTNCDTIFPTRKALRRHRTERTCEKETFICDLCGSSFMTKKNLVKHERRQHTVKKEMEKQSSDTQSGTVKYHCCVECDAVFSCKRSLKLHQLVHTMDPYTCKKCGKHFSEEQEFNEHCKNHPEVGVTNDPGMLMCSNCNRLVKDENILKGSPYCIHCSSSDYACKVCQQRYQVFYMIAMHDCEKSYQDNMKEILKINFNNLTGNLKCYTCKKEFKNKKNLCAHYKTHYCNTRVQCDICFQIFKQQCNLNKHKRYVHNGERNFICDICGKAYKQNDTLVTHKKSHEGVSKNYQCDICGKYLSGTTSLVVHKRSHSGALPFICEICGRAFRQQGNMQKHMLTHMDTTNHTCHLCQKTFKYQETFKIHMKTHVLHGEIQENRYGKVYECEFCGKKMPSASQYKVHKRTHTNERPYECTICAKRFKERGKLTRHLKTHEGTEMPMRRKPRNQNKATYETQPVCHSNVAPTLPEPDMNPVNLSLSVLNNVATSSQAEIHIATQELAVHSQPQFHTVHPYVEQGEIIPVSSQEQFYRPLKGINFNNSSL